MCRGLSAQQIEILTRLATIGEPQHASKFESVFLGAKDDPAAIGSERRKVVRANAKRALKSLAGRGLVTIFYDRASAAPHEGASLAAVLTPEGRAYAR